MEWLSVKLVGRLLHKVDKYTAEWCFNGHDQEAEQDLYHTGHQTANVGEQDADTIP